MIDEQTDTHDPIDGEALLNPEPPSRKKIAGFIALCLLVVAIGAAVVWVKVFASREPAPTSNTHIATTSMPQAGNDRRFQTARTFEFNDEPEASDPPPVVEDVVEVEEAKSAPPPPPADHTRAAPSKKTVRLDKSAASSSKAGTGQNGNPSSGGGLGLVPRSGEPQTTDSFNLFANESSQTGLASQLTTAKTERALAGVLYNRDYLLAKGAYIDCVLNTSLNSTVAGMTKCTLTRHIYSDNGTTLLLERGSEVTGEYRANLSQGQNRLFVLWDRIKTPHGVVIDLSSPATDSLGAGGVDGYVETHFWQRFGGAMMLSLVDDFAAYVATNGGNNVNNFESSSDAAQNMAAEALKHTINIPPTFYKNQGERVGIVVARDLDFSTVYQLKVTQ